MSKTLSLTDEERKRFATEVVNFLEFTRDVLNDPAVLEYIPNGSTVHSVPREERDPSVKYDIETSHMLAIVIPPEAELMELPSQPSEHARRIDRDHATRLKRIRAAHR